MTQDEQHLDLLAIFYFVLGGLTALISLFPIVHLIVGIFSLAIGLTENEPISVIMGGFFIVIATIIILFGLALAVLMIITGLRLRQRRSYTFCMVIGAVTCLNMPLGTILGVFTIIVLSKEPVKELFAAGHG